MYHIQNQNAEDIFVCSDMLLSVLNISKSRVHILTKNYLLTGEMPTEKQGGRRLRERDRYEEQTDSIKRGILMYVQMQGSSLLQARQRLLLTATRIRF